MDRILHQIILKEIDPLEADRVRLDQNLQGARPNHPIVLRLLLNGTREAPSYTELMGLGREEETLLEKKNQEARLVNEDTPEE